MDDVRLVELNGAPGVVAMSGGEPLMAVSLGLTEGRIQAIHVVLNPDKLAALSR